MKSFTFGVSLSREGDSMQTPYEVLKAVAAKSIVFWFVTLCCN
jgi:hypothetical protein